MRQAPNKPDSAIETRGFRPFRIGSPDSAERRMAPARTRSALAFDEKEAAATRRARRWAPVLMAGSTVAAIALLAGVWLLVRHHS